MCLIGLDFSNFPMANTHYWNRFFDIFSKLLTGAIVSFLFYFLLVAWPENRKRKVIKSNLIQKYKYIRYNILSAFLMASYKGGRNDLYPDSKTVNRLLDPIQFKHEFSSKNKNGGIYPFRNYIDNGGPEYKRIIQELKLLQREIDYLAHNYTIFDAETFKELRHLEDVILDLDFIGSGYNEEKTLTNFLYYFFTGFSWIDGGEERDPVNEILQKL